MILLPRHFIVVEPRDLPLPHNPVNCQFSSVEVNCLMVAEVEPWAVLSWSSFGLGDKWPHSEEVLVLGGQGMVRWEVDGLYAAWSRPTSNV